MGLFGIGNKKESENEERKECKKKKKKMVVKHLNTCDECLLFYHDDCF